MPARRTRSQLCLAARAMQQAQSPVRKKLTWAEIAKQKSSYLCSGKGWVGPLADTSAIHEQLKLSPDCPLPDVTIESEDDQYMYISLNLAGWTVLRKDGPRLHEVHGTASGDSP